MSIIDIFFITVFFSIIAWKIERIATKVDAMHKVTMRSEKARIINNLNMRPSESRDDA